MLQFAAPTLGTARGCAALPPRTVRVLDRDNRLVSEGFYQLNLLFREWPNRGTGHHQNADRDTFTQQWDSEHRAGDANIEDLCLIEFRVGLRIYYVNGLAFQQNSADT